MCYTYKIGWTSQNKYYYGVRLSYKGLPEDDLWVKYFTSSSYVAAHRAAYGEPDVIKIDKVFDNPNDAAEHEIRFLIENNCVLSEHWLNAGLMPATVHDEVTRAKLGMLAKGRVESEETRKKKSESLKGKKAWHAGKTGCYSPEHIEKLRIAARRRADSGEYTSKERRSQISSSQLQNSEDISTRVKADWDNPDHVEFRKRRMREAKADAPLLQCPHCGQEMKANLARHIRARHQQTEDTHENFYPS